MTRKRANHDDEDDDDNGREPERKERVIHTRVPESLEAQLRQRAEDLGISVSNLVRNVLGHAFGLVGGVVADSHAVARAARGERASRSPSSTPSPSPESPSPAPPASPASPASISDVLGWQPMVLGKNAVCARCNALLPRGSDAATGVSEHGETRFVICQACVQELRT